MSLRRQGEEPKSTGSKAGLAACPTRCDLGSCRRGSRWPATPDPTRTPLLTQWWVLAALGRNVRDGGGSEKPILSLPKPASPGGEGCPRRGWGFVPLMVMRGPSNSLCVRGCEFWRSCCPPPPSDRQGQAAVQINTICSAEHALFLRSTQSSLPRGSSRRGAGPSSSSIPRPLPALGRALVPDPWTVNLEGWWALGIISEGGFG